MKKLSLFLMIPLLLSVSCSSSDDSDSDSIDNQDFVSITRNGETIRRDISFYGVTGDRDCNETVSDIGLAITLPLIDIETSEFYFSMGISHQDIKSRFENKIESYTQSNSDINTNFLSQIECTTDFELFLNYAEEDRTISIDDSANNSNYIEDIFLKSENADIAEYGIKGNFEVTFTDDSGYNVTITGDYLVYVETFK